MATLILFNKPCGVFSQFSGEPEEIFLRHFIATASVYPAGRLDKDSEGLLLLTDDGKLQHRISHPSLKMPKTYLAQVEGLISDEALSRLRSGIMLKDGPTLPAKARRIVEPDLWPRDPPVRYRKHIPSSWLELTLSEGRNRQVRRMTAATGFPTLRLVRTRVGPWRLGDLKPGEWKELEVDATALPR
jgi:23S rRNA pseudouridine2457 synthase